MLTARHVVLIVAASALPIGAAAAQAVVTGRVVDEGGAPVPGARVGVPDLRRSVVTPPSGRFVFVALPAGEHLVHVQRIGFAPRRLRVRIPPAATSAGGAPADTVRLDVVMQAAAVTLGDVVVSATPTARDPLSVAQSTSTIAGRELERSLGATLGATLARQPGVAARYDGPGANVPIIRGLTGDRVLMLQDGQRASDLASTAPDHGVTVDPMSASRIEIVRGPAALLYGNNALGGVVNVISDDIPTIRPARLTGSVTGSLESVVPGGGGGVEVTAPVGGSVVLRARAGGRAHEDVRTGAGWPTPRLGNTQATNRHGVVGAAVIGERRSAGIAYRGYDFAYGLPSRDGPASWITIEGRRHELLARAEGKTGGRVAESVRLEGTAQWYRHDEIDRAGTVATALALRSQTLQALVRTRPLLGVFRDGAFGASALLRQNGVSGAGALLPANDSRGVGVFAFQEVPLARVGRASRGGDDALESYFRLPVGLRYDHYTIATRAGERFGAGRRREFGGVSGSVGLAAPLAAGISLGANLARAVRPPTAEELYSEAGHAGTGAYERGDPALGAESNVGSDVVLRVARRRVSAQLAGYVNRIDGYIALYPRGEIEVDDGAGGTRRLPLHVASQRRAVLRGLEGSVDVAVTPALVLGAMGDLVRAADRDGAPLPFMPPARLGVSARYSGATLSAGAELRHAFAQRRVPDGELRTDAYTVADVHAGLRATLGGRLHSLTLRVDNVANALYRDAASEIKDFAPNPGRNVAAVYRVYF